MTDFLIKGAIGSLTGLKGEAARGASDIRVRAGKIAAMGENLTPEAGEQVIDASGCVITPGMVNTHHHLFQSVMKSVPSGMNEPLNTWLRLVPYTYWNKLTEENLRVSATIGMAELALSGATTVADHHYFYWDGYDFDVPQILFEIAEQFGMRYVLCRGGHTKTRRFDDETIRPLPTETLDGMILSVEDTKNRFHQVEDDAMRRVVFAPTAPTFSVFEHELKEVAAAARSMGIRLHSHLSENMGYVDYTMEHYGKRPVEWLAEHDWLGPNVWFAHLVEIDEREVSILAETGTGMAHCPQANARLGSGIAPADALDRLGGTVSLAVDGAGANEAADMVSALYSAFCVHRASKGVKSVAAEDILRWATAGGAKVLGLPTIGTLEVGKSADIALFDISAPRHMGQHDPLISPIVSGGDALIRHSFVNGKHVVRDYAVPGLDLGDLGEKARSVVADLQKGAA
ncbi:amidohydrolase [Rhodobacteraceae bacterium RKSG542]|uniref:amidohydrolase family protein n=1 Tax=Pseudovibrio flavus TaxID=2529854 RepID=UPI0012BBC8C7|nr:amidohydrolase family protein [Pseudovibrio flavus]MTI15764.1 amidohydrolase [Pseudovibrio flavus]